MISVEHFVLLFLQDDPLGEKYCITAPLNVSIGAGHSVDDACPSPCLSHSIEGLRPFSLSIFISNFAPSLLSSEERRRPSISLSLSPARPPPPPPPPPPKGLRRSQLVRSSDLPPPSPPGAPSAAPIPPRAPPVAAAGPKLVSASGGSAQIRLHFHRRLPSAATIPPRAPPVGRSCWS